jgi:hypothetical protein
LTDCCFMSSSSISTRAHCTRSRRRCTSALLPPHTAPPSSISPLPNHPELDDAGATCAVRVSTDVISLPPPPPPPSPPSTHKHAHTHAHTRTHARTHAHTHTHTHTHARARTHTQTLDVKEVASDKVEEGERVVEGERVRERGAAHVIHIRIYIYIYIYIYICI